MDTTEHLSEKELELFHLDNLKWKSSIGFIKSELLFITRILGSYIFEPTTLNLFESSFEFKQLISELKEDRDRLEKKLRKHSSEISGILECNTTSCDNFYGQKHELLTKNLEDFHSQYQELKTKIFQYAVTIMKNRKSL